MNEPGFKLFTANLYFFYIKVDLHDMISRIYYRSWKCRTYILDIFRHDQGPAFPVQLLTIRTTESNCQAACNRKFTYSIMVSKHEKAMNDNVCQSRRTSFRNGFSDKR